MSRRPGSLVASVGPFAAVAGVFGGFLGCAGIVLLINCTVGGYCFDYSLYAIFGHDIPWYCDVVARLFLGEIAIPCAVICWIVSVGGVSQPFVNQALLLPDLLPISGSEALLAAMVGSVVGVVLTGASCKLFS